MLPRSSFARYALVAAAAALVALAFAAPVASANNNGFNERILACVESRDAGSDQCLAALEVSPVDSNFFRVLADRLDDMPAYVEPQPEVNVYALVKECAATQDLESEECVFAVEQSGLTLDEFKQKFAAKLGKLAKKDYMTSTMKTCLELKSWLNGKPAYDLGELARLVDKVNYACGKALAESHMSAAQFWSKYR